MSLGAVTVVAETDVDLARVALGVAVRAGTPNPNVSTVEAFKQLLLKAKTVAVPGSTSGIWLRTELFPRLGIAEKINAKATPRGTHATEMVAAGGADLAVMPVSEILHAAGVDFTGSLPPEIQFIQVFSAAVVAGSEEIEGSKRLIEISCLGACFRDNQEKWNGAARDLQVVRALKLMSAFGGKADIGRTGCDVRF
jgi:molybdate transport system substrate-binding protein